MKSTEFREYVKKQLIEIEKFKQKLAVSMGEDPLNVYTMNEIADMWIGLHAAEFRKNWSGSNSKNSRRNRTPSRKV